jgi:aminopeptidase N
MSDFRVLAALSLTTTLVACTAPANPTPATPAPVVRQATEGPPANRSELLRGEYGRYRANNDLLYYHLDVRLDPDKRFLSGKTTIRFRMLSDDNRIQIDLHQALNVDRILLAGAPLKYMREERAVFIDFPQQLRRGATYSIDFYYSGMPAETGRGGGGGGGGGVTFRKDANGKHFINTVCEGSGSSTWWPSKDQWTRSQSADISIAVPMA